MKNLKRLTEATAFPRGVPPSVLTSNVVCPNLFQKKRGKFTNAHHLEGTKQEMEVIFTEEELQQRVEELASQISREYRDTEPLLTGVLTGAAPFTVDLSRYMAIPHHLDFISVSSYGAGMVSSGELQFRKDFTVDTTGRDIIIVEDIVDSGFTMRELKKWLEGKEKAPQSVKICSLFSKEARREHEVTVDYVGFDLPDGFIVGYGLDFAEKYRNLPFVANLKHPN